MAPYFRFPETGSIQQRFWGFPPRNPSCGLLSFETGTKIYAWGKIICCACLCVICALLSLSPLIWHHHSDNDFAELKKNPKMIQNTDWVDKIYVKQSYVLVQALLFLSFIVIAIEWFIMWRLKKAVVERDLPQLKKCFFIICVLNLLTLPFYFDLDLLSSSVFLLEIPFLIFEVMGLIFTHAFIVSLISPDHSQHDDLNRIQFNP